MSLTIAIDGPVGAGKSSVADAVARRLNILHLDTGAMYRALGLTALRRGINPGDREAAEKLCDEVRITVQHTDRGQRTLAEGEDVTDLIRTPEVSMAASSISRHAKVRRRMVALQQELASMTDMVLDGRDICTTVLPHATAKIFLTASPEERAKRRWKEMKDKGQDAFYEDVLRDLRKRDEQDMNRPVEPLRRAEDAELVDTTDMTFDESVDAILAIVEEKLHG